MTFLLEAVKSVGMPVVLIIFFIWRDYRREQDLTERIRYMEEFQQTTLVNLSQKAIEAVNNQADKLDRLCNILGVKLNGK